MTEQKRHAGATGDRHFPIVLILDRQLDPCELVKIFYRETKQELKHDINKVLHWTDSCGSRAVWYYSLGDYSQATDFPEDLFKIIEEMVKIWRESGQACSICMRREDPGMGIHIPEIDDAVIAAGGLPDGALHLIDPKENNQ